MTDHTMMAYVGISESEYKRRIWAWTMYDWANSAFATTILAAVLPIYYSQVAGATLSSAAVATAYWSTGLSVSLLIVAILSPILGTISDVMRGKKRFLAIFFGLGIVATGLLVLVETGDWLLASILFVLGRIGFTAANVFYDALLPHVAREEDRDSVSTRGYAMGYLGGGLLLAINILMIQFLPGTLGPRLSFISVAIWWAVFSTPIFLRVPEPPAATAKFTSGWLIVKVSFQRLWRTLKDIHQYRELFKYLVAFLIYIDGIGTIIGVAAIYGAELGFGSIELVLALLLVQFVGIPYSLIFGRLPSQKENRRPFYLAFVLYNIIALPLGGILGSRFLPGNVTGMPPESFKSTGMILGEGVYPATHFNFEYTGEWETISDPNGDLSLGDSAEYRTTTQPGSKLEIRFLGREVKVVYSTGPDQGVWAIILDGKPLLNKETGLPETIDGYSPTVRYGIRSNFSADLPGEHTLILENTGNRNPLSQGVMMNVATIEIQQPERQSNLGLILAFVVGVQLIGLILALVLGSRLFSDMAQTIDTRRGILLALIIYTVIAVWGFFLNSVIEFWFLAWMVAVVQGGSQALSRSLFSNMSPASKSGEFFGLFGIMEKFSAIVGPLVFAFAATRFGSSRPAVLSIIAFFIVGGYLLTRVNVDEGRRIAKMEDAVLFNVSPED